MSNSVIMQEIMAEIWRLRLGKQPVADFVCTQAADSWDTHTTDTHS